jgi:hypothetical protein
VQHRVEERSKAIANNCGERHADSIARVSSEILDGAAH